MAAKKKKAKSSAKSSRSAAKKPAPKKRATSAKKAAPKKAAPKKLAAKKKLSGPQIVHWEIQSTMPERLHGFYRDVFGWAVNANNPMSYGLVSSGGEGGIHGGIGGTMHGNAAVVVYAAVPSIEAMLAKIEEEGGRTVMPRTDVGPVIMALYLDPEGNTMGLIEA